MITVFKYPLSTTEKRTTLKLPKCAQVLNVLEQHGNPMLYAMVNTDVTESEERVFETYITGEELLKDTIVAGKYINTFKDGYYVVHAFEIYPYLLAETKQ